MKKTTTATEEEKRSVAKACVLIALLVTVPPSTARSLFLPMTPLRAVLSTFFPSYEQATQATVSWQRVCDRVRGTVPIIENLIIRDSFFFVHTFLAMGVKFLYTYWIQ
jgi:hypothetical protein